MWNGPLECRLFRFDMVAGSARTREGAGDTAPGPASGSAPGPSTGA